MANLRSFDGIAYYEYTLLDPHEVQGRLTTDVVEPIEFACNVQIENILCVEINAKQQHIVLKSNRFKCYVAPRHVADPYLLGSWPDYVTARDRDQFVQRLLADLRGQKALQNKEIRIASDV